MAETPRTEERERVAKKKGGVTRAVAESRMLKPFFSSTFSDFTDEREHLTKKIFPQFIKMCEQQSFMFSPIDLRWGVSTPFCMPPLLEAAAFGRRADRQRSCAALAPSALPADALSYGRAGHRSRPSSSRTVR